MNKLLVTVALGAAMLSSAAFAQDDQGGRGRYMQNMTRAQAQQQADAMFQRIDLNHDGVVTRQEAEQAAAQYGGGKRIQKMIDRTFGAAQSLTLQQFEEQQLARFDRDDLNHDGVVTVAERQQARATLKAERANQAPSAPQVPPPPPPGQ
jgi:Ca2+-binding EF-hand superfamily protein